MGGQIKQILGKVSDVRPRHKRDYYRAGKWLVSRRLLYWVSFTLCVISIWYILTALPANIWKKSGEYPAYRYNSLMLKFYSGKVKITGETGYTAYIGQVKKGAVEGEGSLFRKDGTLLYAGEFEKNQYQGEGTLYRRNGTKSYSGSFQAGMKQGDGKLFNENGTLIYAGNFQNDELVYEELTGKKTEELAQIYQGDLTVYSSGDMLFAHMPEIHAMYCAENAGDTMEGGWEISAVYILKDKIPSPKGWLSSEEELTSWFGKAEYSGTTRAEPAEAAAINCLQDAEESFGVLPRFETEAELADAFQVTGVEPDFEVYIRTYRQEGLYYTFFGKDRESGFSFYLIQPEE